MASPKLKGTTAATRESRAAVTAAGSPPPATAPKRMISFLFRLVRSHRRSMPRIASHTIQVVKLLPAR